MQKILMIAVLIGACAVQQDVSSTAQQICQDDPDMCPGGHPITLRQRTLNESASVQQQHLPEAPTSVNGVSCGNGICTIRIEFSGVLIIIQCEEYSDGSVSCWATAY